VRRHDPESQRLVDLARAQRIDDPNVAAAWQGFVEALDCRWFMPADLDRVIEAVRARQSVGNEEFFFDFDPPGSDEVISRFVGDEHVVPADAIVAELERLRQRYRGGSDAPAAPPSGGTGGTPPAGGGAPTAGAADAPVPDLLGFLQGLVGNPSVAPAGDALQARLKDVGATVVRIVSAMQSNDPAARARAADEAAALQRTLAAAGGDAARWSQEQRDEVARAVEAAGGADVDRLAQGLRTIAAWLEQRSPQAGAAVDKLVEGLDQTLGPFLTRGKKADEARREEEIRADARASIAQRLREAGVKPSGES